MVEKELLIQEKEKLYMELKQILQRQPGPEVAEQLQIYQQTLKEKTKHMKVSSQVEVLHNCSSLMSFFESEHGIRVEYVRGTDCGAQNGYREA